MTPARSDSTRPGTGTASGTTPGDRRPPSVIAIPSGSDVENAPMYVPYRSGWPEVDSPTIPSGLGRSDVLEGLGSCYQAEV